MADFLNAVNGFNEASELPWLVFTLGGNAYAVNSSFVNGIEMKPKNVIPLPEAPDTYRGLVERRGEVYPLLDMRKTFHFPTIDEETERFKAMMEQRKKEHIEWIDELERCAETGKPFELATDPHKCAFGMWYDQFSKENSAAAVLIRGIEAPHAKLHETAHEVLSAVQNGDKETAAKLIRKARKEYVPKIIEAIDESEHAYKSTFKETVVVLKEGDQMLGLLVDKVLAVDKIHFIEGSGNLKLLSQSRYFCTVARNDRVNLEILVINEKELLKLSDVDTSGAETGTDQE